MTTTSTFNLRDFVKEILDASDDPDPAKVANEVLDRLPKRHYRDALEQSLSQYVRVIGNDARRAGKPATPEPTQTGARSWKVTAIREQWRKTLETRVHVEDGWKFLRDMTADDLTYAAQERDSIASRNLAWARHYRHLGRLVDGHGVKTVGDLPDGVLAEVLGRAE